MNAPERTVPNRVLDWSEANQRLLVAEFARLRILLSDGDLETVTVELEACRFEMPSPAAIDTLARLFQLSPFERDLLLLAAGVEMDARISALCGKCAGQPQRPWATFGLALAALPNPHWSAVAPLEPLRRWRLVEVDEAAPLTTARLKIDERILHFIGGLNYLDHRLQAFLEPVPSPGPMSTLHREVAEQAAETLRAPTRRHPPLMLVGDDASAQEDVAATIAARLGIELYCVRGSDLPTGAIEQSAFAALWMRDAALLGCGLLVVQAGVDWNTSLARLVARIDGLVIVAGRDDLKFDGDALRFTVDRPDAPERRPLWQASLGASADPLASALDTLASQYRLDARRIGRIAAHATSNGSAPGIADLHRAIRDEAGIMPSLGQRIDARARWSDLILPEAQRHALRQVAVHARHRLKVHYDWGFADQSTRGLGIATLFWGDSGTGKTLAAEVLANELCLALYRIDLSAVVSKYIGETEKNLRKVFEGAEDVGAILLFDEADALFGKRSEVKDSHDRYANIEVSYLLQRMDAYSGLAILTTNQKTALDPAFQRRLRFVVHFPFPDQAQREGIWRVVFPTEVPLDGVDFVKLARLSVTGGTIRNIALSAAFLAADAEMPVGMAQLLHAAHLEAAKCDRAMAEAEIRGWV